MRHHVSTGRKDRWIIRGNRLGGNGTITGFQIAGLAALGHQLVRHVRARQRGIVGHNLIIKHGDLHALAGDTRRPCVAHAHTIDTPIHTIRSHRRRHTQPHTSQHRRQRRHHAALDRFSSRHRKPSIPARHQRPPKPTEPYEPLPETDEPEPAETPDPNPWEPPARTLDGGTGYAGTCRVPP